MVQRGFKQLMAEANAEIETISVHDALVLIDDPQTQFVDIRERHERQRTGGIKGSVHAPRGHLEFIADPESSLHKPELATGKKLILYCATGGRSTLAAKTLQDMGIEHVLNLAGGFAAWTEAGGKTERG